MIDITYNITFDHDCHGTDMIKRNEEVSYHYSSLTLQNY